MSHKLINYMASMSQHSPLLVPIKGTLVQGQNLHETLQSTLPEPGGPSPFA